MPKSDAWLQRYWAKVDVRGANECWPWKGYCMPKGHGQMGVDGRKLQLAHRLSYELFYFIVPVGTVCHTCDNPPCCNPLHLYDGTAKSNAIDMASRSRQHLQVFDVPTVRIIRERMTNGETARGLAREYGVSPSTMFDIRKRRTYGWLDAEV